MTDIYGKSALENNIHQFGESGHDATIELAFFDGVRWKICAGGNAGSKWTVELSKKKKPKMLLNSKFIIRII